MKLISEELGFLLEEFHDFHETNFTNIFLDIWFHELVSYVFFLWFPSAGDNALFYEQTPLSPFLNLDYQDLFASYQFKP